MVLRHRLLVCCMAVVIVAAVAVPPTVGAQAAQGSTLNGRVTNTEGTALPNATVNLAAVVQTMPGMTMTVPAPIPGRVNPDGTFVFNQVPAGNYVLQVDAPGFSRSSQAVTLPTTQNFAVKLEILEIPGAEEPTRPVGQTDTLAMQAQIAQLEQRVRDLEATTVLSEPETRTRKTTVYIDKNSNIYDKPTEGAKKTVTYQRERVYRRENINEKIDA